MTIDFVIMYSFESPYRFYSDSGIYENIRINVCHTAQCIFPRAMGSIPSSRNAHQTKRWIATTTSNVWYLSTLSRPFTAP